MEMLNTDTFIDMNLNKLDQSDFSGIFSRLRSSLLNP